MSIVRSSIILSFATRGASDVQRYEQTVNQGNRESSA
jgi:hypothetical protein